MNYTIQVLPLYLLHTKFGPYSFSNFRGEAENAQMLMDVNVNVNKTDRKSHP